MDNYNDKKGQRVKRKGPPVSLRLNLKIEELGRMIEGN
jgi:hypothetical protein